jgi:hypothetical protein
MWNLDIVLSHERHGSQKMEVDMITRKLSLFLIGAATCFLAFAGDARAQRFWGGRWELPIAKVDDYFAVEYIPQTDAAIDSWNALVADRIGIIISWYWNGFWDPWEQEIIIRRYDFGNNIEAGRTYHWPCHEGPDCRFGFVYVDLNLRVLDSATPWERQKTICHELGHALGLSHPQPGDNTPSIMIQGPLPYNVPQSIDVLAIQLLYP